MKTIIFKSVLVAVMLLSLGISKTNAQYTDYYFYLSNQTNQYFSEIWLAPTGTGNWKQVYFPNIVYGQAQITFRGHRYQDLYIRTASGGWFRHNGLDMAIVEKITVGNRTYQILYGNGTYYNGKY